MKSETFFKVIFFLLSAFVLFLILGVPFSFVLYSGESVLGMTLFTIFICLFVIGIVSAVSVFIYKDAKKRGMNKWMWMTIAVFVPNFLGLIIYLIVRNNYTKRCPTCGKKLGQDYLICPYCGNDLSRHCPSCGREISAEWAVCPYCKYELKK